MTRRSALSGAEIDAVEEERPNLRSAVRRALQERRVSERAADVVCLMASVFAPDLHEDVWLALLFGVERALHPTASRPRR